METFVIVRFRFFGVPTRIHWSALILVYLVANLVPGRVAAGETFWVLAAVIFGAVILVLFSLLVHERAHVFAASRFNIACHDMTVIALGAVARLESTGRRPREAFTVAAAGPFGSAACLGVCLGIASVLPDASVGRSLFFLLANINAILALFNLLPVFPLDGGRIAHAIAWAVRGNTVRGLEAAVMIGRAVTIIGMSALLVGAFLGAVSFWNAIWIGAIAALTWFLSGIELRAMRKQQTGEERLLGLVP